MIVDTLPIEMRICWSLFYRDLLSEELSREKQMEYTKRGWNMLMCIDCDKQISVGNGLWNKQSQIKIGYVNKWIFDFIPNGKDLDRWVKKLCEEKITINNDLGENRSGFFTYTDEVIPKIEIFKRLMFWLENVYRWNSDNHWSNKKQIDKMKRIIKLINKYSTEE